jgi:hypothetical protein
LEVAQKAAQGFERIAVRQPLDAAAATYVDASVFRGQDHVGVAPEEGVPCPLLTALYRFQQEGVRAGPETEIRRQRRVQVCRQLREYGNEVPLPGELSELVARGRQRRNR